MEKYFNLPTFGAIVGAFLVIFILLYLYWSYMATPTVAKKPLTTTPATGTATTTPATGTATTTPAG